MKKQISDSLVDLLCEFMNYVERQEGDRIYVEKLEPLISSLLTITKDKWGEYVAQLGMEKVMIISGAEQIISKSLKEDMEKGLFYKDIYKNVKKKVALFAEMHGKSEVISKALKCGIEEEPKLEGKQ